MYCSFVGIVKSDDGDVQIAPCPKVESRDREDRYDIMGRNLCLIHQQSRRHRAEWRWHRRRSIRLRDGGLSDPVPFRYRPSVFRKVSALSANVIGFRFCTSAEVVPDTVPKTQSCRSTKFNSFITIYHTSRFLTPVVTKEEKDK